MSTVKHAIVEEGSASELPERFRGDLEPGSAVTVIVVPKAETRGDEPSRVQHYWGAASRLRTTTEESVARIRALRDEWD